MDNIKVFNFSALGASHITENKPCQDYSLSWNSDENDIQVVIVCDGHGSSTYVRSDVGSRLAAQCAMNNIKLFIEEVDPLLFVHKKAAVTAREGDSEKRFDTDLPKPIEDMTETERMNYEQKCLFVSQVLGCQDQDEELMSLFTNIYNDWILAIKEDSKNNPFNNDEKKALGNSDLVKAYGTTLMAFVRTPYYWFAFQIGDGRLLVADNEMQWSQPVPWDCNCFLNFTTSLCNSNPIPLFRYAFDGTGYFPSVVLCCSDGVEDSYGDFSVAQESLYKFYTEIVARFHRNGYEKTVEEIENILPRLSSIGSKDDMSLAGIVDFDAIALPVDRNEVVTQRDKLKSEHVERVNELEQLESKIKEIESQISSLLLEQQEKKNIIQRLIERYTKEKNDIEMTEANIEHSIIENKGLLAKIKAEYDELSVKYKIIDDDALQKIRELKSKYDQLNSTIKTNIEVGQREWEMRVSGLGKHNSEEIDNITNDEGKLDA